MRLLEAEGKGTAGHVAADRPPTLPALTAYLAERYQEIDRGEHGGITMSGINAVLDEMGVTSVSERRSYRRIFREAGAAEAAVRLKHFREKTKAPAAPVSDVGKQRVRM